MLPGLRQPSWEQMLLFGAFQVKVPQMLFNRKGDSQDRGKWIIFER